MVERKLDPEVARVISLVDQCKNFLLSGGAGSGKTYSLVQVIKEIINKNPNKKIACMTYTNAAVKEIQERVNHDNLYVSTIHEFLWGNIKSFQKNMKTSIVDLLLDENSNFVDPEGVINKDYFNSLGISIQYGEISRIRQGKISHDEVIELSAYMFEKHTLLCDIVKDKFPFILIDEYQDTHPLVINIFLESLKKSNKRSTIGFFGDSMQSIYDAGIGDLNKYLENQEVIEVKKEQNRRNPELVIELANKLRTDDLIQKPSEDDKAPNMQNGEIKKGKITFLYSLTESDSYDLKQIKNTEYFSGWNFNNSMQTKELYLTHNLIAYKAGFTTLMDIYGKDPIINFKNELNNKIKKEENPINENLTFEEVISLFPIKLKSKPNKDKLKIDVLIEDYKNKESYEELKNQPFSKVKKIYLDPACLIDDKKQDKDDTSKGSSKRDNLIKHLFKIQNLIQLYNNNSLNEFIRKTQFSIRNVSDKKRLKDIISKIESMSECTIEEVINYADENNLYKKDDAFQYFVNDNSYIFNKVKAVKFKEFQNLFSYLEGYTPFSTQHKIKGAEFDNVFVVLDNGKWNNFNFESLFTNECRTPSVLLRTQKIFYVCCTRAKENLVIYYHKPNVKVVEKAKAWFGEENVKLIDDL
ncbi:UvrD-helicase domain-containing protein [Paenibacillus bovis]|uniref:DNA/RNA helicase n=1 Tax=Paenibacillus bovis TaxID=1616788 RepID=A0A172ZJ53_9BACL|nr:UvrD-helicase domain-containing protein [Paenibacillus bovis]ANF97307.1 DNA/RNA helicase [Paenibacillus bovis]